jgi:putative CocE/NonD family hydrolase
MFLASDGRANSLSGTGSLSPDGPSGESPVDMMPCNPLIPVNSVGGRSCCVADTAPMGPADQRCQEIRNDVLVYTSEILDEDLLVIGRPQLTIYLATDSRSVDVVAKLTDVHPDGRSIAVSDGVRRLRPGEADQGKRVELSIEMSPTAICFKAGHRIRLTLAGSDFPARDRNPHNGENALDASWSDFRIATEVVFHDASCPSRVVLPLV